MSRLLLTALVCASAMVVGTAQAQSGPAERRPAGYFEIEDDRRVVERFNMTVDQLDDLDVFTAAGERIGEVEEVLMDATGHPVAVSVELRRSVGGSPEHVVALDRLRLEGQRLVTDLTRAQIEALPLWDD